MKNLIVPNYLFLLLFGLLLGTTSCDDDTLTEENEEYLVDIQIVSPDEGTTLAVGQAFTVEVDYTRADKTIHNVLIEIVNAAGHSVQKLVEKHAHVANEFTFKQEGIVIDQAGTYKVKAISTDLHIGEEGEAHGNEGHEEMTSEEHENEGHGNDTDKEVHEGEDNIVIHTFQVQ